jgi:energy-coupling factor transport system ATP-binding protein
MVDGEIFADHHPDGILSKGNLQQAILREPLYVSAARWAGMTVESVDHPSRIDPFLEQFNQKDVLERLEETPQKEAAISDSLLELEQLAFHNHQGPPVLEDVTATFQKVTLTTIVSQNGAGKSTLAKVLSGYQRSTSGRILLNGTDITHQPIAERAGSIGFVLQNPNHMISKHLVQEEIRYGMHTLGLSEAEENERLEQTLGRCGLYLFRNWPIQALSFGQKKRVTIASILVRRPDILILDEPTAGQDYRHYSDMMGFLEGLKQEGITLLIITHDMHLVLEYSDQVCLVQAGRIRYAGTSFGLLNQEQLLHHAHLKQTSLFTIAKHLDIDPERFIESVITAERKEREQSL